MRKFSNIISLAACFVLLWGCDEYDDGELRQNIDAIEQELTETEKRVERLNEEMNSLSALINSSFISYLKQDDEGNYVISYRDHGGETKTVTLATQDDVVTAPIVGAGEFTDGKLYWRTTADNGKTYQWLLDKEGKMMPWAAYLPRWTSMPKDSGSSTASVSRTRKAIPYWPTMSATPSSRRWRPTKRAVWSASRSPTEAPSRFRCSKP